MPTMPTLARCSRCLRTFPVGTHDSERCDLPRLEPAPKPPVGLSLLCTVCGKWAHWAELGEPQRGRCVGH